MFGWTGDAQAWTPKKPEEIPISTGTDGITRVFQEKLYNAPEEWQYAIQILGAVDWRFVDAVGVTSLARCRTKYFETIQGQDGIRLVRISRYLTNESYGKLLIHSIIMSYIKR